jgi:ABC-type iron transport system FetAB permease component
VILTSALAMNVPPSDSQTHLSWANVGLAFSFIAFDAVLSSVFGLHVGHSLVTAAIRCIVQLAFVATLLQKVFETENPFAVAGIACEIAFTL